jgi:hypothetical protein
MWDCEYCKCQAIAAGLDVCPMCHKPRSSGGSPPVGEEVSAGEAAWPEAFDLEGGGDPPSQAPDDETSKNEKSGW